MSPDAPLPPQELRSNRLWILLLAGFSISLLFGSIVFAVVRMPAMLVVQIRGAISVEVETRKGGENTTRTLKQKESRETLAKLIEASQFSFTFDRMPADAAETTILRVIAPNRTSEVRLANAEVLQAGFTFRARLPQPITARLSQLADEK